MSLRKTIFGLLLIAAFISPAHDTAFSKSQPLEHEPLRFKNTFRVPEDVIRYYCARDASGFVWSGLLEIERKAFTLWKDIPQQDSFYIANKYEVMPGKFTSQRSDEAVVEVMYEVTAVGDANGTIMPLSDKEYRVTFTLRKDHGAWKISEPGPALISPVVLESKFPYQAALAHELTFADNRN
ncbi:MAG: hypothetical protein AABZ06_10290 [Bdellovibrionota bacterium]